ncbi:branched-chain amino acid transport system II carrier protein [Velocimicrobium porci]|uniref:Branched-chain amino acid transport system carrier protein n=1 Tax=Velocimicrobium porci TaxID=2606634 RepID=A0A6L5XVY7_9FIRM|nr:branched-chain amino acid transport system II carrier protein [Velocimicrobium porci]MSS62769.1 branched-chain amino acid transport system II carrier protein [Velocimicrobium porci]
MENLSQKNKLLIGLTLFSMFFGAGNLIFPPFLGAQAGTHVWTAFIGFAISAIGFPILGVISVAKSQGLSNLANRVHPYFSSFFTLLIYLSIGPCLAIPRTASTSFEMAVTPFFGNDLPFYIPLLYSVIFFFIALLLAWKPENLTDKLGKITTPCLLTLILIIVIGCLLKPIGGYGNVQGVYQNRSIAQGFLDGYQTMDTIAALNFGIIISMNIKTMGVKKEQTLIKETMYSGVIAGILLLIVYGGLAHVGAISGGAFEHSTNGAQTLTNMVSYLFGDLGTLILALIFVLACMNTCVGLFCCCSEYFHTILPKISYHAWVCFFALISTIISNAGLNKILEFSVPVLNTIYPIAIVLIILSFLPNWFQKRKIIYKITIGFTTFVSIINVLEQKDIIIPTLTPLITRLPFYQAGFAWLLPAITGIVVGILLDFLISVNIQKTK